MGDPGARVGACPPPLEKEFFLYFVAHLLLVLHGGAFLQRFSPYGGHLATFSPCGGLFWAYPSPPTEISAAAHGYRYGIATH